MKLFIGGLDYRTDEVKIEKFFGAYKITLLSCLIARDAEQMSRCFGFVTVADIDTEGALKLSGKFVDGKKMKVKKAGAVDRKPARKTKAIASPQAALFK